MTGATRPAPAGQLVRTGTRHYIAATAGHIDHGKSALVQALTGTDPDRLPEEKRRGITIELGFAHLALTTGAGAALRVGIVDVPGHEDFVKNMVAGVGAVDLALLVVAANEGWMPQTEEHLQILEYLGARATLIALTKSDLLAPPAPRIRELRRLTAGTRFADCPVVPVSAVRGDGLDELRRQMGLLLDPLPARAGSGTPRLAVDRAFTVAGAGTVVTGTLAGGSLSPRQEVVIYPGEGRARIRTIQSFGRSVDQVGPATRVALNLPDARPRGAGTRRVQRGDVVARPDTVAGSNRIDVRLNRSARLMAADDRPRAATWSAGRTRQLRQPRHARTTAAEGAATSGTAARRGGLSIPWLRDGTRVRLHHGTANLAARVVLEQSAYQAAGLAAGASCWARLYLDQPRPFLIGDRVVLRDWSQRHTLAGGFVLDPAPAHPLRSATQRDLLDATNRAPHDPAVVLQARAAAAGVVQLAEVSRLLPIDGAAVAGAATELAGRGALRLLGDLAADTGWFNRQVDAVRRAITAELQRHPERSGVAVAALRAERRAALTGSGSTPAVAALRAERRSALTGSGSSASAAAALRAERGAAAQSALHQVTEATLAVVIDAAVAELARHGYRREGSLVRPPGHAAALPPGLESALAAVRAALVANPLAPPGRAQLADRAGGATVVAYLIASGELLVLAGDVVMATAAYRQARTGVADYLSRHQRATTSALRIALGTNRRLIVPLLERLDRDGVTLRIGNERALMPPQQPPE